MKFIKASERLPVKYLEVFIKYRTSTSIFKTQGYWDGEGFEERNDVLDNMELRYIEWLDESLLNNEQEPDECDTRKIPPLKIRKEEKD